MNETFALKNITKTYGSHRALDNVSLSGHRGQVIALLGENGAGKTTALRILLGLLDPDDGEATVLGMNSKTYGEQIRTRVGYVSEKPVLYEWMKVSEIGWFAAGFYPPGFQQHYETLIRQFNLPPDRRIKQLSKGMKAKVALALAMAHQPDVLILDEPTSGLDPLVRYEFLESMVEIAGEDRTVILSSHQIAEVERVADSVAILRQGKLVAFDPLDDLKTVVQELTLTLEDGVSACPTLPGTLISCKHEHRQWKMLVRGLPAHEIERLQDYDQIQHVATRTPNLEEIYVAYMQPQTLIL